MRSKRIGANATLTGFASGAKAPAFWLDFPAVETAGYNDGVIQSGGKPPFVSAQDKPHSICPERQLRGCCYS
jgi:hypothetical protein